MKDDMKRQHTMIRNLKVGETLKMMHLGVKLKCLKKDINRTVKLTPDNKDKIKGWEIMEKKGEEKNEKKQDTIKKKEKAGNEKKGEKK